MSLRSDAGYTIDAYRRLLSSAKESGYSFAQFEDGPAAGRRIFLRHDVDYSPALALELARENAAAGARGTFFLLLRSHVYNLLCSSTLETVREIAALGQTLALHYAVPPRLPETDAELARLVVEDFETVRRDLPEARPVFAWHNTTPELLERSLHFEISGMVNVYGEQFVRDMAYFSDTNLRYTAAELEAFVGRGGHEEIHLLLHPFNWVAGGASMVEVFARTWRHVIREREVEMLGNRVYAVRFAGGMPADILDRFAAALEAAARAE